MKTLPLIRHLRYAWHAFCGYRMARAYPAFGLARALNAARQAELRAIWKGLL